MNNEKNNNKDLVSVKETEHPSIDEILEKETFLAPLTDIYETEDEFILTAKAGKTGIIKIKKNNPIGRMLINAYNNSEEIKLLA